MIHLATILGFMSNPMMVFDIVTTGFAENVA